MQLNDVAFYIKSLSNSYATSIQRQRLFDGGIYFKSTSLISLTTIIMNHLFVNK